MRGGVLGEHLDEHELGEMASWLSTLDPAIFDAWAVTLRDGYRPVIALTADVDAVATRAAYRRLRSRPAPHLASVG
jgi:hypothetical protein